MTAEWGRVSREIRTRTGFNVVYIVTGDIPPAIALASGILYAASPSLKVPLMVNPKTIWSSSHLPTLPAVAVQLLELSEEPHPEIHKITQVIKTDPAISAKILKSTNSSYFAFRNEVTSIDRAVPLLGATMVTSLALSFSLVEAAMTSGPLAEHYKRYWMKSVLQAVAGEMLGEQTQVKDQFFLAGLLADLGRLAMLKTVGREYAPVLDEAEDNQRNLWEVERERLGFDSIEIGTKLMERWKLPAPLIQAAAAREQNLDELQKQTETGCKELIKVVAVASAVSDYFCASNKGPALERMRLLTSTWFDMDEARLEQFLNYVKSRMEEAAGAFSVNAEDLGDPVELMALANEHLSQLAVREHVAGRVARHQQTLAEEQNRILLEENKQLHKQVLHDPLTKLYNRNFFEEALAREVHVCRRSADPIAVIFCDVDHFKRINDNYGHPFGDFVLEEMAQVFQDEMRNADVLARYGGEEFVILAVQPTEKGLEKVTERIRFRVENHGICFGDDRVPITVSVGAALIIPRRNSEDVAERLLAEADEAMYESKRAGRNRVTIRCLMQEDERRLVQSIVQRRFSRWLVNRQILDIPTASRVLLNSRTEPVPVGELGCQHGCLDSAAVQRILDEQLATDERFGEAAVRLGLLTESQLAQLLAWQNEDPKSLAQTLIRCGVLGRQDTELLLDQYLAESALQRASLSAMEIASFM